MKKLFNLRLPVALAIAFTAGVFYGYVCFKNDLSLLIVSALVPAAAAAIIFALFFPKAKKALFILSAIFLFFTAAALDGFFALKIYDKPEAPEYAYCTVTGTVEQKSPDYIIISRASADGNKLSGKIIAELGSEYGDYCAEGYKVEFRAKLTRLSALEYGKINPRAADNIKYQCNIYGGLKAAKKFSLPAAVRRQTREALFDNADEDSAAIAYAMITGNTEFIDYDSVESFRYGGIAHIFAVSGLHVGVIYGLVHMLCRLLRLRKRVAAAVEIALVAFYVWICGFTLSATRALIMCAASAAARIFWSKYDSLNALSVAIIFILAISPISLFDAGFRLSVCTVGSIAVFARRTAKALRRLPRKIAEYVSVSLAAQAGSAAISLTSFGYLSAAGLVLNIALVPLLSAAFTIVFTGAVLSVILPFAARFIVPAAIIPLQGLLSLILSAGFENAIVYGFGAGAFSAIYFVFLAVLCDKFNFRIIVRIILAVATAAMLIAYALCRIRLPISGHSVTVDGNKNGGVVIVKSDEGCTAVLAGRFYEQQLRKILNDNYALLTLKAVIQLGGEREIDRVASYTSDFGTRYVSAKYLNAYAQSQDLVFTNSAEVCGAQFTFIDEYSVFCELDGIEAVICLNQTPFEGYADMIIGDTETAADCKIRVRINDGANSVYNDGKFIFNVKNGKIKRAFI